MIICVCNNVSSRDITREVAAGCPSFGQLQMRTGVGAGCGCCHDCAREAFSEARMALQPKTSSTVTLPTLIPVRARA